MHFSFIGKVQFRRATLSCDSSYLYWNQLAMLDNIYGFTELTYIFQSLDDNFLHPLQNSVSDRSYCVCIKYLNSVKQIMKLTQTPLKWYMDLSNLQR